MTGVGLFVYGSLKKGESNHASIQPWVREVVRDCYVFGEIYIVGSYPGLVTPGTRKIRGELLVGEPLDGLLQIIDAIEGSDYERILVEVHRDAGAAPMQLAWAYRFVGDLRGLRPVTGGEWRGTPG